MARIHTILQGFVDLNLETNENIGTTIPSSLTSIQNLVPTINTPQISGITNSSSGTTTTNPSGTTVFSGVPSGFTPPAGNLFI